MEKSNKLNICFSTIDSYILSDKLEKQMFGNCIFIFDTSALFNIYYLSKKSQMELFDKILSKLENRLWIPHHVQYEYLINREKTMMKPIEEKYGKLEKEQITPLKKKIKAIENNFIDLKNRTHENETHPYMKKEIYTDFEKVIERLKKDFDFFFKEIDEEISIRKSEIESLIHTDTVFEDIKKYFKSGREYSYDEIENIMDEGKKRYAEKIPPGYEDEDRIKKVGIQKYGDLIIWNQIIEFASQEQLPIIFITNDLKSDWCYADKNSRDLRIEKPKEELIKEIKDKAGVSFWMYSFSQFLYKTKKILEIEIESEILEEAYEALKHSTPPLIYNGIYFSDQKERKTYIRFYENGNVESAMVKEFPRTTLKDDNYLEINLDDDIRVFKSKYNINGDIITFDIDVGIALIKYVGTILNKKEIIFDVQDQINGIKRTEKFLFLE